MKKEYLIDKYIRGTITDEEKPLLETLITKDPDIQNEINFLSDLKVVAKIEDRDNLKKLLTETEEKLKHSDAKAIPFIKKPQLWIVAASVLLITGIGITTLINPFATSTDQLYADNFEPYKNVVTPSVRSEDIIDLEKKAFLDYESGYYKKASTQFAELYKEKPKSYFLLYQANCLMALNAINQAIPLLEKQINDDSPLAVRGKWYLSLAYLKEGNKKKAKILLIEVISEGSFKTTAATRLLQELN